VFTVATSHNTEYQKHPYFSAPDYGEVKEMLVNVEFGVLPIETRTKGVSWGSFKNAFIALRHGLYGPSRWGIEFRVGAIFGARYEQLCHTSKKGSLFSANTDSYKRMLEIVDDTVDLIKWFRRPLCQKGFDESAPVRLIGWKRGGNAATIIKKAIPGPYSMGSLIHFQNNLRRGTSCFAPATTNPADCDWPNTLNFTAASTCAANFGSDRHLRKVNLVTYTLWDQLDLGTGRKTAMKYLKPNHMTATRGYMSKQYVTCPLDALDKVCAKMASNIWNNAELRQSVFDIF